MRRQIHRETHRDGDKERDTDRDRSTQVDRQILRYTDEQRRAWKAQSENESE